MSSNKILTLNELSKKIQFLKRKSRKIVHCHGVFDVLHLGHIKHFNTAKNLGDILVVTVTPDKHVNKGPNRPIFPLEARMQCIAALKHVDYVAANTSENAVNAIKNLKPNIYCKGKDYVNHELDSSGQITEEAKAVKRIGGKIFYTSDELFSSSKIINSTGFNLSKEQKKFLDKLKTRRNLNSNKKISDIINSLSKLKVLVIGETIIDEYQFCEALGKSGKEPVLVLRDLHNEKYLGGAAAIARNLSNFCKNITLLSNIGEKKEHISFINQHLQKNVKKDFLIKKGSCTIIKKRFVDDINKSKVLGVYSINDNPLNKKDRINFDKKILKYIKGHDLVVVSDYGHGLISDNSAKLIIKKSKFLAVNAQLNAANIGYHTISKYVGADLIIINENEMRHELRNKIDDVNILIRQLADKLKSKFTTVTSGNMGSRIYVRKLKKLMLCPAFAKKITDKIGTGDTMLALLSIAIYKKIDINFSMLISALAAAMNIQHMGNSIPVKKTNVIKALQSYLS